MEFDDLILPQVGEYGLYQKLIIWLICLPASIPCGFHAYNHLFMTASPDHWCKIPELLSLNVSEEKRKNLSIPKTTKGFEKCLMYDVNYTDLILFNLNSSWIPNSSWPISECQNDWEFDLTHYDSTVVTKWNLVCSSYLVPTFCVTAFNVGSLVGMLFFGWLQDRYGRKLAFIICFLIELIFGLATAFSPNIAVFALFRFMVGLTVPAIYQIPFVLALEWVGPIQRTAVSIWTCIFYVGGFILCGVLANFVRDWSNLAIVTALPFIVFLVYIRFLPESPRWLLMRNKIKETEAILLTVAKCNGKTFDPSNLIKVKQHIDQQAKLKSCQQFNYSHLDLFKTPNMRNKSLLIIFNWLINTLVYIGLSYYATSLGSNPYISFILSGVIEVPSYILLFFLLDYWGRRWPLCLSMIIGGVACVCTVAIPGEGEHQVVTTVLSLIGKFGISMSFMVIYIFAGELFPTVVRGLGIGLSCFVGGIGVLFVPFVNILGNKDLTIPLVVFGILAVIGGVAGLRLPETLYTNLPQTLADGEEFGRTWSLKDLIKCCPEKTKPGTIKKRRSPLQIKFEATPMMEGKIIL